MNISQLFDQDLLVNENFIVLRNDSDQKNQAQTNDVFSTKWTEVDKLKDIDTYHNFQNNWYLKLYGFEDEAALAAFLQTKKVIFDAGCGLGVKTAWFARLAPESVVIGMDFSDAASIAARNFKDVPNLYFIQGDIANTGFKEKSIDYVSCDQVIMHTESPELTFGHLAGLVATGGEFACYVYAQKALPRELLDDYFRKAVHNISQEELDVLSTQLTELGKRLSELNVSFECPDIPLLGIKGGSYDIQRFIYWNFLKCFWREEFGFDMSKSVNFDWYSPSNAKRFSKKEFLDLISGNNLQIISFHEEEACFSGRFKHNR